MTIADVFRLLRFFETLAVVVVVPHRLDELELWDAALAFEAELITADELRRVFLLHVAYEQAGVFG